MGGKEMIHRGLGQRRTSEQLVLQAPPGHELVDEEELRLFPAVAEEADEVRV